MTIEQPEFPVAMPGLDAAPAHVAGRPPADPATAGGLRRRGLLSCVALPWLAGAIPAWAVVVGDTAPDVALPEATPPGVARLADLRGRTVYLDFWASWCAPCRLSFPWMNEMQTRHGPRGLQVVAVNLDARRADALAFLTEVPARFTVAFDAGGVSARAFAVKAMPTSVLIDAAGRVRAVHRGFRPEQREALEASIVAALPRS